MKTLTRLTTLAVALVISSQAQGLGIPAPFTVARAPSSANGAASITPTPSATPAPSNSTTTFTALWVGQNSDASNWTTYAQDDVLNYGTALLKGSDDVEDFCPNYSHLGTQDRANFWVQLIAAMVKYESGFNPASRMVETTGGIDPVTGKQMASEGLLQLSYADAKNYKSVVAAGVCDFDYAADQQYSVTDLHRTILDPKSNLRCGIGILNRQVQRDGLIAEGTNAYWAVIKTDRSTNKLSQIKAITQALSICK